MQPPKVNDTTATHAWPLTPIPTSACTIRTLKLHRKTGSRQKVCNSQGKFAHHRPGPGLGPHRHCHHPTLLMPLQDTLCFLHQENHLHAPSAIEGSSGKQKAGKTYARSEGSSPTQDPCATAPPPPNIIGNPLQRTLSFLHQSKHLHASCAFQGNIGKQTAGQRIVEPYRLIPHPQT